MRPDGFASRSSHLLDILASEQIAKVREGRAQRGECADCALPVALKKNGKPYRLCRVCLKKDRERATATREEKRNAKG